MTCYHLDVFSISRQVALLASIPLGRQDQDDATSRPSLEVPSSDQFVEVAQDGNARGPTTTTAAALDGAELVIQPVNMVDRSRSVSFDDAQLSPNTDDSRQVSYSCMSTVVHRAGNMVSGSCQMGHFVYRD